MRIFYFIFCFLFCSSVLPAIAEEPPISDWTNTEVVIVRGKFEGPAFWHITKDGADIWIMGTLNPLPDGLYWNEGRLKGAIIGARQIIMPPVPDYGFLSTMWFALTRSGDMKLADGKKLDDVLPDDLRARFQAVRTAIGAPQNRYQKYKPVVAAMMLVNDYDKSSKLLQNGWNSTVEELAREAHVKIKPISEFDVIPLFREMLAFPEPAGVNCFARALRDIDNRRLHIAPVSEAWAAGNIAGIKAHYIGSSTGKCISDTLGSDRLQTHAVDEVMAAIDDALAKPGKDSHAGRYRRAPSPTRSYRKITHCRTANRRPRGVGHKDRPERNWSRWCRRDTMANKETTRSQTPKSRLVKVHP